MCSANSKTQMLLPLPSGESRASVDDSPWRSKGAAFCPPAARPAFTLVELLVTITIMSILAAIALFALAGVEETAKRDKTIATIRKLNGLVMAKYESYRTRRVPIDILATAIAHGYVSAGTTPQTMPTKTAAQVRLDALHELMRMEMPDRYSDIIDDPVVLTSRPAISTSYLQALPSSRSLQFEGAKCLYLVVTRGLESLGSGSMFTDADVISLFNDDEIARDSSDGLKYFVDGWGQPIYFIRWAPGFSSPLQPWNVAPTDAIGKSIAINYPTTHDPFDPMHVYIPLSGEPFYNPTLPASSQVYPPLYPLIFSGGPDQITDIYATSNTPPFRYSKTTPNPNNPYAFVNGNWTSGGLFGVPADLSSIYTPQGVSTGDGVDNSIDNITNHDLSQN